MTDTDLIGRLELDAAAAESAEIPDLGEDLREAIVELRRLDETNADLLIAIQAEEADLRAELEQLRKKFGEPPYNVGVSSDGKVEVSWEGDLIHIEHTSDKNPVLGVNGTDIGTAADLVTWAGKSEL